MLKFYGYFLNECVAILPYFSSSYWSQNFHLVDGTEIHCYHIAATKMLTESVSQTSPGLGKDLIFTYNLTYFAKSNSFSMCKIYSSF